MTRQILDKAFGPALLKVLQDYGKQRSFYGESRSSFRRGPSAHALGEEKDEEDTKEIDALAGTDEFGGKLQVIFFFFCVFSVPRLFVVVVGCCCCCCSFNIRCFSFFRLFFCFFAARSLCLPARPLSLNLFSISQIVPIGSRLSRLFAPYCCLRPHTRQPELCCEMYLTRSPSRADFLSSPAKSPPVTYCAAPLRAYGPKCRTKNDHTGAFFSCACA